MGEKFYKSFIWFGIYIQNIFYNPSNSSNKEKQYNYSNGQAIWIHICLKNIHTRLGMYLRRCFPNTHRAPGSNLRTTSIGFGGAHLQSQYMGGRSRRITSLRSSTTASIRDHPGWHKPLSQKSENLQVANKYMRSSSKLGMVVYTCNAKTLEAEVGLLGVQGQPKLHSEFETLWNSVSKHLSGRRMEEVQDYKSSRDCLQYEPSKVVHAYNPNTPEAEARISLQVRG